MTGDGFSGLIQAVVIAVVGGVFSIITGPFGHVGLCSQPSISAGSFQAAVPIRAGLNPVDCGVH
ncbi:MAG: hypothetical protein ABR532_02560 [Candidatus Dormibacteria bacterium]